MISLIKLKPIIMKFKLSCMSMLLVSSIAVAAPDISYEGITTQTIARTPAITSFGKLSKLASPKLKSVTLLKLNLSEKIKKSIQKNAAHAMVFKTSPGKLPASVQLGMNTVPVLDQGFHGTCATFALTAALDALKGQGDYYSELCSLNLGKHLAANGYGFSGWDGQSFRALLARVDEFGLISKHEQQAQGCGGLTEYPVIEEDTSAPMSIEDFHSISTPAYVSGLSDWSTLYDAAKWSTKDVPMDQILEQTKTSIHYGNRVLIGALLPITIPNVGAQGSFHAPNDSWVLTGPIEQSAKLFLMEYTQWGGHAMIITGYNDNAVAMDNEGHAHKGLFTLRNSWGSDVGDKGNFYMSYDYFSTLAIELEALIKVSL